MGLKSFYLAVNCHFFFAGLRPPHTPLGATAPPRPPELGPVARAAPQNVKLGYRQKSPLAVRPQKKQRCRDHQLEAATIHESIQIHEIFTAKSS